MLTCPKCNKKTKKNLNDTGEIVCQKCGYAFKEEQFKEEKLEKIDSSKQIIESLIDNEVVVPELGVDFCVSTGSLLLDLATNGGIRPSVIRLTGQPEGGKTSCSLQIIKNFLETVPNSKAVVIPSEGKLNETLQQRSGVKFVEDHNQWEVGTCLILYTQVFEKAFKVIADLINNNPENHRYAFLIDSLDALSARADYGATEESGQPARKAVLSSKFFSRMAIKISAKRHLVILISQVRSKLELNQYARKEYQMTNASGGNALLHYSSWIFEFQGRYQGDKIWAGEQGKSEILGHYCKIIFKKSVNEKSGVPVDYPIKYGRAEGKSVWVEYEIIDMLAAYGQTTQKGAWITLDDGLHKELIAVDDQVPKQFNGMAKFREYLEENPKITNYLFKKIKERLT
jgi:RecA/RadA recombinase